MNTTSPISREATENHTKFTNTLKHTTGCSPAHQKDKIQPHPPEHRHQSLPPGSLHNPPNQVYPLGADTKNNGNYEPAACKKETTKHSKLSKMRRQRNTQQMKEQGKNPPDQTNEEEIGSLCEKEIRVKSDSKSEIRQ